MKFVIEKMEERDWPQVCAVYQEGLATGNATFEIQSPPGEKWDTSHHLGGRLVAKSGVEIVGWAALSSGSDRQVYSGVAEVSIYIAAQCRGLGIGTALLKALVDASEQSGIWTLQAGIFPENEASIALHEKLGFRLVGRRERIGKLNGIWRYVLLLERRSPAVGIE